MIRRQTAKPLACILCALSIVSPAALAVTLDDLQADVDAGRFTDARDQSSAYLADHPGNRDARFLHARALAGMDKTNAAIAEFKALADDFPLRAEPANNLAVLYARQGDYDQARKWLDKALATQPAYATAHRNLGDVYTALADLAYRRALGSSDSARKVPLTLLDRLYYAQESVAPGDPSKPAPTPPKPAPESVPAPEPKAEPKPETPPEPVSTPTDEAAEKTVEAPPPADDNLSIVQTLRAWALAWSSQDFDGYTDFYADAFDPGDGMNRSQWLALRRARLAKPDKIHIRIEDPAITPVSDDRVQVDFVQRYESPSYSDQVKKRLLMQRTRAGWRILRETSASN
ncbi:L,D-transpeptidase Cds6 family protein [Salinisphaera aquimarina]|uniref:Tetratricopeptide repeat protein n=1 Tax=Salinisphaera aquimarina TaxID=2094031 RepID=A0ABV7EQD5_9GAMM